MRPSSLKYLIKQGWQNMSANRLMTLASIGVLTACLIITGIASLISINVNRVVDYLANQNEIVLYINEDATEEEAKAVGSAIEEVPNVLGYEYVDRHAAYEQVNSWLADYGNLLDGYEEIFPPKYLVSVEDLNFIDETSTQLGAIDGVERMDVPSDLAGVMITLKNAVNYGGWGLVIILAVVSTIVINNTIRLTVFARRREINIMKYVGATNTFIRFPFFIEGMSVGIISGLLASGVVCGGYYVVYQFLREMYNTWVMSLFSSILPLQSIWMYVVGGFVLFGVFIGGFGTATSIRKHLKV